ncbi:MAG: hypothetical protein AB9836_02865 [Aminipila sp.]
MERQNSDCMNGNLSPKQIKLYNLLRQLWVEHVMWTRFFLISTAGNLGDLDLVTKRLLRNPTDFAYALSLFYNNQSAMEFENLFTEHLAIASQLVNAAKAGDAKTADEQRKKWYENANNIAKFLGDINPNWNQNTWQSMLYDHLKMTEDEAVQILNGQYSESIDQFQSIQEEALKMADVMACGIIKQFNV